MEIVRQLQEPLRSAFRRANATPWRGVLGILSLSGLIFAIGVAAGLLYCEARRVIEFQQLAGVTAQLATVGERCILTLDEVSRAAIIFARNDRPRPVPLAVRDSARAARWTTPP